MDGVLRQSTAVDVLIGPFSDSTDGWTPETGLSPAVKVSKNGQTMAAKNDATTPTHDADGHYNCELDATDVNTVGVLVVTVAGSSTHLAVRHTYQVIEEAVFDALYGAAATGLLPANVTQISGDSTAADSLEAMYDGTGYNDETAPASRSQISGIAGASGAALNFTNEADNVDSDIKSISFVGTEDSGTNASVNFADGTYHVIGEGAGGDDNAFDIVYQFDVGGGRTATELVWTGYLTGGNDEANIQVYNGSTWDTVQVIDGKSGSSNDVLSVPLFSSATGTGADLGKVYVRIVTTGQSNPELNTDQLYVSAANIGQSVGYAGGAIWVDTTASNTNTEAFVDGVADNPVSTWAAALTLASSVGLRHFHVLPGSSITLSANSDGYYIDAPESSIALNGQSIEGAVFLGANVSGVGVATVTRPHFQGCSFGAVTLPPSICSYCSFTGAMVAGSNGQYLFADCVSGVAGSGTPTFDFDTNISGATGINSRRWSGGSDFTLNSNCTVSQEVLAGGGQTFTTGGADVEVRGICRSVNFVLSNAGTIQFVGTTGVVTISGTATSTVNLYGISSSLADTSSGTTVTDKTISSADVESILVDTAEIGTAGAGLTAVPWNASWDAEVQSECADALTAYDPPTNAEMEARTIVSASYATATALAATDLVCDGIKASTDNLPSDPADQSLIIAATDAIVALIGTAQNDLNLLTGADGVTLATAQGNYAPAKAGDEMALTATYDFAKGTAAMTQAYAANGATPTPIEALYAIHQMLMAFAISGTALSVKKLNGSTEAFEVTLDDDTAPTSAIRS
ncbi:MAG: hypothetical protein GY788_02015 [bacterium]|nr:hypothetical protein [bacterium]